MTPELALQILDYASVAVFAVTGALVASRSQLDIVACLQRVYTGPPPHAEP